MLFSKLWHFVKVFFIKSKQNLQWSVNEKKSENSAVE